MKYSVGNISAADALLSGMQSTVRKYMEWQTGNTKCSFTSFLLLLSKKIYVDFNINSTNE
jgi:hypothetical protein